MGAIKDVLSQVLDLNAPLRILEVGVGRGDYLNTLIECFGENTEFVGIDTIEAYLEIAKERFEGKPVHLMQMDGHQINFEANSFDIVTISNSLHHVENPSEVLEQMKQVVKPDGFIAVHEMVKDSLNPKQKVHTWTHHMAADIDTLLGVYHGHTYTKQDLQKLISALKLKVVADTEYLLNAEINFGSEKEILDNTFTHFENKIIELEQTPNMEEKANKLRSEIQANKSRIYATGIEMATEYFAVLTQNT